jgi:hypothetical protein
MKTSETDIPPTRNPSPATSKTRSLTTRRDPLAISAVSGRTSHSSFGVFSSLFAGCRANVKTQEPINPPLTKNEQTNLSIFMKTNKTDIPPTWEPKPPPAI